MPVTATHLTTGAKNSAGTSSTTASISPSSYKLVLIAVGNNESGGSTPTPTVSGCGLTWVQVATKGSSDGKQRITLLRSMGASPSSGALTISTSGSSDTMNWSVVEFGNVITSGSNGAGAVVQSATAATESTAHTTETVTLSAFDDTRNATYGAIRINNAHSVTQGTGFTELAENTSDHTIQTQWRNDNDTSVTWSFGSTTDRDQAVAVEIAFKPGRNRVIFVD